MEEYKKWIEQAGNDIKWSESGIKSKIFYGACFAAQQSVEKSLKAFLLSKKRPLRKIHDVLSLLEECIDIDKSFEELRHEAAVVVPYYVETRYPDLIDIAGFDIGKSQKALTSASKVLNFVKKKI